MSPHFIVEHEEVVIKCQCNSAIPQALVRGLLALDAAYNVVAAERTLIIALMNQRSAHVISWSQWEETENTYIAPIVSFNASGESILCQFW